jgi:hypothetical protein
MNNSFIVDRFLIGTKPATDGMGMNGSGFTAFYQFMICLHIGILFKVFSVSLLPFYPGKPGSIWIIRSKPLWSTCFH